MPVVKTLAFIKRNNGSVTLLNFTTGEILISFTGGQNLIKDTLNPNRFFISSLVDTSRRGININFLEIDGVQCVPSIATQDFNLFLEELAKSFFFGNIAGISISQKVASYNDLIAGETAGEISYVEQSQGTRWLIGSLGGTYYPNGWYLWNGTLWVSDTNAIATAINETLQTQGSQGIQGVQGIQGLTGDTGEQGIQGIQGEKGDTGEQGIQGDPLQTIDGGVIF